MGISGRYHGRCGARLIAAAESPGRPVAKWGEGSTKSKKLFTLIVLAALAGIGVYSFVSSRPPNLEIRPQEGYLAPDFEAVDVFTGKAVRLSQLRGKPVFINFWATWCPPCREEMPAIERIYQAYRGRIEILAVGFDPQETEEQLRDFARAYQLSFPILRDSTGVAPNTYLVRAIPTSFFMDSRGVIRVVRVGKMDEDMMKGFIARVSK